MPRLFVAVWPPDDVLDLLASLARPAVDGLRWTTREQWHVTLRFLGSVDDVEAAAVALASVQTSACQALLGPATARFGQRVLHVPVSGLDDIAAEVIRATSSIGEAPEARPFAGHVTLARVRGRGRGGVDLRPLTGTPIAAAWSVTSVCLVESRLGRGPGGAAAYDVVTRLSLPS